ncbi:MAG: virginiamycin lyase [Alphaproteobacteria bacterium]|nr:virginiamycin lyase [Alphaproteobacteria bacterium]
MRLRIWSLIAAACAVMFGSAPVPVQAQGSSAAALTGKVSAPNEGALEGVVVSAKKGIVTVSVVSNDKGEFSFPASKLGAGDYALSIRASGYDLEAPKAVTLAADKPVSIDVKLAKTKNLAAQLTNLEWILSVPGDDSQKRALTGCTNCHTVERILTSTHNAEQMYETIKRMATYSNNSFHMKPQVRAEVRDINRFVPNADKVAEYFASINRSNGEQKFELKTMPRVSGDGTKVIITEYDLPDAMIQPHDVITDASGTVWHSDFSGQMLGRFDTKTLEHKAYQVPLQREGWPTGALDLEVDPQGNLWLGLMFQAGTAKFDVKTEQFKMFQIPPHMLKADSQTAMVGVQNWTVDNKIWLQDPARRGMYRMDVSSGNTELFEPFANTAGGPYTVVTDKQNSLWFLNFGGEHIGKIDAKTGQSTLYPTPTKRSRPRRGRLDDQGRIWFAEFGGERVGMFDIATERFKEWEVPGKFFAPYDVALDKNGNLWTGGMNADRILRLNTETGKFTEYPLPHSTNVRRVFVDNNTTPPTFWVGNNHGAALIKIEPQD